MIRRIREEDRPAYLRMAKEFYDSEAVQRAVPERHFADTFAELMRSDAYVAAYILEREGRTAGYALLAKSFSQEAGGMVLWVDELYVLPEYRGLGLGHEFFSYLRGNLCGGVRRVRLELEESNRGAGALYRRMGFEELPYRQMIRDF